MSSYKPPYSITSKMVNLISAISEEITRIEYNKKEIITPQLRKKIELKLWQSVILYHWREVFLVMPTESIVKENQEKYYRALEDSGNMGESTPFIEFMLEVILNTVREVGNRVGNEVGNNLTENQFKIIENISSEII